MTIWQDRHKICSSDRTHRTILRHYLCCLDTKYVAPTGPTEASFVIIYVSRVFDKNSRSKSTHRIVLRHSWSILAIFFPLYFQVSPHPESYLVDFSSLISFSLELSKFRRPSNFQNVLYWAFWIAVVPVFLIHHFRNKKKMLSLYV